MTDGKTSRIAWLGYGLAALLAVALGVVLFGPGKQTGSPAVPALHYIMELPPATPATAGVSGIFSISRDGSLLAYRGGPSNQPQIFLRRMADTAFRPLPGTERGADPAFSPDGQWIAYRAARARLMKLSITGGAPEVVCQLPGDTRGIHWGTDGYIYFGIVNDAVQRVPASGGTPEPATRLDSAAGELSHRYPVLLPDGKTLLFTIKPSDISTFDDAVIAAEQVSGTGRKVLVRGGSYPRYLHSGHLMYLRGNSILAVPFDADRVESTGQAVEVGQGGWMLAGAGSAAIDVSDNGLLVYAPSGPINGNTQTLSWLDRSGKSSPLLDTLRSYSQASLSPDGQKVAVGVAAANNDVWIYNIPRNQLSRLTFGGGNNDFPIWSPDGKYVVYSAEKGKALNIFRKPWDGSGKEERLTSGPGAQYASTISPDGRTLVYSSGGDIFAMPIGEPSGPREPRVLFGTPTIEAGGLVSPDGRWLAYLSDESGKRELFVTSFPKCEGKWQVSNGGAAGHLWSRDGRELFYFNADAVMSVEVKPGPAFDYSTPRRVLTVPASVVIEDIAPDGRRFLVRNVPQDQALLTRFAVITDWFDRVRSKFEGTGR